MRGVVIGAGLAGLTAAAHLRRAGHGVLVLDKGRGAGGRASTRRGEGARFDHGACHVAPREPAFARVVSEWVAAGVAAPWGGSAVELAHGVATPVAAAPAFVGQPGMSAVIRHAGREETIRYRARAAALRFERDRWEVTLEGGERLGPFELAVLAVPAAQATPLLEAAPELAARVAAVEFEPCWSLLAQLAAEPDVAWRLALPSEGPLARVSREHTKPGRAGPPAWVVQANGAWSRKHVEDDPQAVVNALLVELARATGGTPDVHTATAHRWRFARATRPLGVTHLHDAGRRLGVCGDWCLGSELEDAYLSGAALGRAFVG